MTTFRQASSKSWCRPTFWYSSKGETGSVWGSDGGWWDDFDWFCLGQLTGAYPSILSGPGIHEMFMQYIYIHISLTIHMNHFVQSICNQVVGVSLRWNNARPKYEDPSDLHTLSDLVDSTVKMWNKFSPGSWGRFELRCVNMWSKACPCIQGSKWTRSVISFRYGPTPRLPRCSWYFLPAIVGH